MSTTLKPNKMTHDERLELSRLYTHEEWQKLCSYEDFAQAFWDGTKEECKEIADEIIPPQSDG